MNENQSLVHLEVFKDHWKQILNVFSKSLINDDDVEIFKNNFDQLFILLIDELIVMNRDDDDEEGPILNYLLEENIFEVTFLWSLSYPEYLYELKYLQLKYYEVLLANIMNDNRQLTNLLFYKQLNRPLFSLLNHCSRHKMKYVEKHMILVLNQLCVCICKDVKLLSIFFDLNNNNSNSTNLENDQGAAKFLIFSLLVPYIHQEGYCGQQARDALLMIMQLSTRNLVLAKYIVENTDFCPILATGLSALYSELPQKLGHNGEEVIILTRDDVNKTSTLCQFINSLEFCNNVIQVSHSFISYQLLQYVYNGFLIPVIAPALNQNCIDEVIAATAYLDLFIRTISEEKFRKLFLKFILYTRIDDVTLLDTLISRISSNNKLSFVTLMLFYTLIDMNSEDVLYKLILSYLIPCKHIMKSQINSLKETTLNPSGKNAEYFLSLSTIYASNSKNVLNSMNKIVDSPSKKKAVTIATLQQPTSQQTDSIQTAIEWLRILYENKNYNQVIDYLENMKFNFTDYLNDAKSGVETCKLLCLTNKWSINSSHYDESLSKEIGIDADEYILNLFTNMSTFYNEEEEEPVEKKEEEHQQEQQQTSRTVTSDNIDDIEIYLDKFSNAYFMDDDNLLETTEELKSTSKSKEAKKKYKYLKNSLKQRDFYVLSFDNEISSSSSSSESYDDDDVKQNETVKEEEEVEEEEEEIVTNEDIYIKNRDLVINYFFSNQQTVDNYLNSSLNSFLKSLDNLNLIDYKKSLTVETVETVCTEIIKIYSNICENKQQQPLTVNCNNGIENESMTNGDDENEMMKLVSFKALISEHSPSFQTDTTTGDIGPFLKAIFNRLEQMLNNSLQINVLLTGLIARLCHYPQPILRSYLLDHNLVLESNVKSLIQVLNNVRNKIDSSSQTYNNFTLLYLQAEICLIKRLIDPKSSLNDSFSCINNGPDINHTTTTTIAPTNSTKPDNNSKKSFGDKILDLFRRPSKSPDDNQNNDLFPQIFGDFSKLITTSNGHSRSPQSNTKTKSQSESFQLKDLTFTNLITEWDDLKTRNIAYGVVIYDEFLKELASICQEHCVQQSL